MLGGRISSLVVVSHPEKVLFPDSGVTKGDVADYYHRAATVMLPHLVDRPLTIQRFPQGIDKQGFMQKHAGKGFPDFIERIELAKQDGTVKYPVIRDEMGLAYLANQNTITLISIRRKATSRASALRPRPRLSSFTPSRSRPG
jgi:bifunctional non-homologous end joining protein LigD